MLNLNKQLFIPGGLLHVTQYIHSRRIKAQLPFDYGVIRPVYQADLVNDYPLGYDVKLMSSWTSSRLSKFFGHTSGSHYLTTRALRYHLMRFDDPVYYLGVQPYAGDLNYQWVKLHVWGDTEFYEGPEIGSWWRSAKGR